MDFSYNCATTLNLGDAQAEHNVTVFANLGCPFCRKWYINNWSKMIKGIEDHKLALHLKFLNKPKRPLHNGNIANLYVDYRNPRAALEYVKKVYAHQDYLDNLDATQVPHYLTSQFNVTQKVSDKAKSAIINEAKVNHITSVPTIILDDNAHADSSFNLPNL